MLNIVGYWELNLLGLQN